VEAFADYDVSDDQRFQSAGHFGQLVPRPAKIDYRPAKIDYRPAKIDCRPAAPPSPAHLPVPGGD
jgi:hypothetical protein